MSKYVGKSVRFVVTSDDFSTPAPVVILDENNATVTLGAGQRLAISTLNFNNGGTARLMTVFDDANADSSPGAAEILDRVSAAANSSYNHIFPEPLLCGRARNPKVIAAGASAGSSVTGTGLVID